MTPDGLTDLPERQRHQAPGNQPQHDVAEGLLSHGLQRPGEVGARCGGPTPCHQQSQPPDQDVDKPVGDQAGVGEYLQRHAVADLSGYVSSSGWHRLVV